MSIEWREPPAGTTQRVGKSQWVQTLEPLMERPTLWAMVRTFSSQAGASSCASNLRKLSRDGKIDGKWEFAAKDGEVFARFMGPE
jgi:hypothetical protein